MQANFRSAPKMAEAKLVGRGWDPNKTYDLSQEQQRAVQERAQMRAALKHEWQMKVSNPHRGMHGYIFDPAVQRFLSMRATHWDHFKATPKTTAFGVASTLGPILFFWYIIYQDKMKKEHLCRTGQIAYKDRLWKYA